jgi:methyl-accepting chemotaxis protein
MKNLRVSAKLLVGFGIAAVFTLAVGLVSMFELERLNKDYTDAIDIHGKPLKDAGGFLEAVNAMSSEVRAAIIFTGNIGRLHGTEASMLNLCKAFEENTAEYEKTIAHPSAAELFSLALNRYEMDFKPSMFKILEGAKGGANTGELTTEMASVAAPAADFIVNNMKKIMDINVDMLNSFEEKGNTLYKYGISVMATILALSVGISIFLGFYISGLISKPMHAAVNMISEMGKGHLSGRLRLCRNDEIGVMADTMDKFAEDLQVMLIGTLDKFANGELTMETPCVDDKDELGAALKRIARPLRDLITDDGGRVLQAAARKDLSLRLTGEYKGDFAKMKNNINAVMENLDDALTHVAAAAGLVSGASAEIAADSQRLAESSSEQAGALAEVSASLEEISLKTKHRAKHTHRAKALASEAHDAAVEGDAAVRRMAAAVKKIKLSSDNTAKIVKTVNDIAYETSLLSLNASVEAARAGEAGRGFAAVTGEMRNLAKRGADAAKNSAAMIGDSAINTDTGVKITEDVAISLAKIIASTGKTDGLIAEIAADSSEQAHGLELVNDFLAHMNRVNHSIAADTDESAAAAAELSSQAAELANLAGGFILSGNAGSYYADRNAAEVWVDIEPVAAESAVSETLDEPVKASASPAAVSAHKRRQRHRRRMEAHRAERTFKRKRRMRTAINQAKRRKYHARGTLARAVQAREVVVINANGRKEIMINA